MGYSKKSSSNELWQVIAKPAILLRKRDYAKSRRYGKAWVFILSFKWFLFLLNAAKRRKICLQLSIALNIIFYNLLPILNIFQYHIWIFLLEFFFLFPIEFVCDPDALFNMAYGTSGETHHMSHNSTSVSGSYSKGMSSNNPSNNSLNHIHDTSQEDRGTNNYYTNIYESN